MRYGHAHLSRVIRVIVNTLLAAVLVYRGWDRWRTGWRHVVEGLLR
jgi:hypothetical protein